MGGKIPNTIRRQVITQWLYDFSRDQIAKDNEIGAGTVSTIIKQCKEQKQKDHDFEFDLIRQVAVMLKREGVDVNTFASSIRLQRKLEQNGLSEEQIESFVENMDVHCFKWDLLHEYGYNIHGRTITIYTNPFFLYNGKRNFFGSFTDTWEK
jgi:hypothetical protein